MDRNLLDYETVRGPLAGTALLTALGVPTVSGGSWVEDWGVAVVGAGVARDGIFGVHHGSCQQAAQRIGVEDLTLIREARCDCNWTAEVTITDPSLAPSAVQDLTYGFYNALDCSPPCPDHDLLAERRAVHFGVNAAQALESFLTANTPRRPLAEAIRCCATRLRRYADEAHASLRRDGMMRLQAILEQEYTDGHRVGADAEHITTARRRAALADAENTVPQSDSDTVACFYRRLEPCIDTALAASDSAAYTRLPRRTRPAAVAVLPRRVAVLLYADFGLTHPIYDQSLTFAAALESCVTDVPNACRVAADLWRCGTDPEVAWQAAVAAVC